MAAAIAVESWDDEFEGNFPLFAGQSMAMAQSSISSRMSVRSESLAGDDEYNLVLQPSDTAPALESAQRAGIPIPNNVPQSALLGGTIKRLGKKKSRQRVVDDWDNDIEMPDSGNLKLKTLQPSPLTPTDDDDAFEDLEGSLGIRFAGSRRDARNRSSSFSGLSPSIASVTVESEDDELRGLELPEGPMDFEAILRKRRAADAELSDLSQPSPAVDQTATMNVHKKSKRLSDDNADFLNDFDLGVGDLLDARKRTLNKNIKVKNNKPAVTSQRGATTVNFHDKPTDKPLHTRSHIPRPVSGSKPAGPRLEPVFESGASHIIRERRQPTTTSAQLLKSKRSAPALRSYQPSSAQPMHKSSVQFLPAGVSSNQPQHGSAHRPIPYHLRRDSDPHRGRESPPLRSHSRLSNTMVPDTPSRPARQRADVAPTALVREAAAKRTVTKPARRRNYGDGNELDIFDDLPTSMNKESKFVKQPVARGPIKPALRQTQSRGDFREAMKRNTAIPDRMTTPAPPRTPASPTKGFHDAPTNTPSYLRDTAASRIARETRLANNTKPRSEGPLMPMSTNWKAQTAARSPHTSPSAQRHQGKRVQPQLIKAIGANVPKSEKGMVYNPQTLRWEGNENTLAQFELLPPLETPTPTGNQSRASYMDHHRGPSSSPPRPALIAPMSNAAAQGIQVNGGMVFDPRQMKWLKLKGGRDISGPLSPSATDGEEENPFAGIEDLKDEHSPAMGGGSIIPGMASPVSMAAAGVGEVHEEFDLGPRFIESQKMEESAWDRRCAAWFVGGEPRPDDGRWRWAIRDMARFDNAGDF